MKHRLAMLAAAVVTCLGTAVAVVPSPAQAAPAVFGVYIFYLQSTPEQQYCLNTNGVGNEVTVTSNTATCANVTVTRDGLWHGNTVYQFRNGNDNCIRANSSNQVKLASGPCSTTDAGAEWIITNGSFTSGSVDRFENLMNYLWLKTTALADTNVLVGTGGENNWLIE
jgi:hypothetical protein